MMERGGGTMHVCGAMHVWGAIRVCGSIQKNTRGYASVHTQ